MEEGKINKNTKESYCSFNANIEKLDWFFNLSIPLCPKLRRPFYNLAHNKTERLMNHSLILERFTFFFSLMLFSFLSFSVVFQHFQWYLISGIAPSGKDDATFKAALSWRLVAALNKISQKSTEYKPTKLLLVSCRNTIYNL